MMKPINFFYDWFRTEAEKLPADVKQLVLETLKFAEGNPKLVFMRLNLAWEAKRLPASWGKVLTDFFWSFCS